MIKKITSFVLMVGVLSLNFMFMIPKEAMAASLTSMSDTVTSLNASTPADHTIVFTTPTGIAAGATMILTFDNSTNIDAALTFADIDLKDNAIDLALAAVQSGSTWGVTKTGTTILTFTNGTSPVLANHVITIRIGTNAIVSGTGTKQITNGIAGTTVLRISGTFGDTGAMSMSIISNSVVAVSAEVLSSLSFTVSQNAIYFGNLRTGGACFAQNTNPGYVTCPTTTEAEAFNMAAGTNATAGYTISVQGATLTSGGNTITPLATNTASSPGSEQFGLRATATGGSGVVQSPYAASGYAYTGTATTPATFASFTAPSATTTYSVRYLANISPTTEAGSYTTSHTYVATGNF